MFLLVTFGLYSPVSNAQITITQQHMPSSGDTIRYSNANLLNAGNPGNGGANQQWDFSNLSPTSQGLYEYKASLQTPYILNFGFNAIGLKIADTLGQGQLTITDVYNFYRKSSSGWDNVGIGFRYSSFPLPQSGKHSDPDEVYVLPMNYNDSHRTTFSVGVPISLGLFPIGNYYQSGTRTSVVDGWGTITTPYGDNISCLRVRSTIDQYDSIAISQPALNFGFPNSRVEYKWISTSEKIPILEMTGTLVNGRFTATQIRYRDKYRDLSNFLTPEVDFTADKTSITSGEVVNFSDESSRFPNNWDWAISPNTGWEFVNGTNAGSQNPSIKFNAAGTYDVRLRAGNLAGNGSLTKSNMITVQQSSSIDPRDKGALVIYPNPATECLHIQYPTGNHVLSISNALGQKMIQLDNASNTSKIQCSDWESGIYLLHLQTNDQTIVQRILIQ